MEPHANSQARLKALIAWRDESGLPDDDRMGLDQAALRRVAEYGGTEAAQVAKAGTINMVVFNYAPQIAALLRSLEGDSTDGGHDSTAAGAGQALPDFAHLDMSVRPDETHAGQISARAVPGGFELSWPAPTVPPGSVVVYRVYSSDDAAPTSPEEAIEVAQTDQPSAIDDRLFTRAVRHYRVWANVGPDPAQARLVQPTLVAQGAQVGPVQNPVIEEQHGQVVGSWQTPDDAASVVVYRHSPGTRHTPEHRLRGERSEEEQLAGFLDLSGEPGRTYQYSVCVKAWIGNGYVESAAHSQVVEIPARPQKVTDLTIEKRDSPTGSGTLLDFSWTRPPSGVVRIYLSQTAPDADLPRRPLHESALQTTPLRTATIHPVDHRDDRSTMRSVPWPTDWHIAHVTPVTVVGQTVQVGTTVSVEPRMNEITEAEIRERVDTQVAVFGWPDGATEVAAYVTLPGESIVTEAHHPIQTISKEQWQELGGLDLKLGGEAVDVHLVPRAWLYGAPKSGGAITLRYQGMACLRYQVSYGMRKRRFRDPERDGSLIITVTAGHDVPRGVRFALVHDTGSLPLSDRQDSELGVSPVCAFTAGESREVLRVQQVPRSGWIRLFAEAADPSQRLALLDPPVRELRLTS